MSPAQRPFVPFTNAPKLNPASGREVGPIPKVDGEGRKAVLWAVVLAQAGGQLREGQVGGDGRSLGMGSRKGQSLVMLRSQLSGAYAAEPGPLEMPTLGTRARRCLGPSET